MLQNSWHLSDSLALSSLQSSMFLKKPFLLSYPADLLLPPQAYRRNQAMSPESFHRSAKVKPASANSGELQFLKQENRGILGFFPKQRTCDSGPKWENWPASIPPLEGFCQTWQGRRQSLTPNRSISFFAGSFKRTKAKSKTRHPLPIWSGSIPSLERP